MQITNTVESPVAVHRRPIFKRKHFLMIHNFLERVASLTSKSDLLFRPKSENLKAGSIVGHGNFRYRVDECWGVPENKEAYPVKDCHEMVMDSSGRLYVLTNHEKNNILIYNTDGDIIDSWTLGFKSAHGLTLASHEGEEYLYICDFESGSVVKTTLSGEVVLQLKSPKDLGIYENPEQYLPSNIAVASNGDIYVADGYGSSYVIQYDKAGNYIRHFGGLGKKDGKINQAHGIAIDSRSGKETLIISSRMDECFKRFTMEGEYLSTIPLSGAYPCRPVIHKDKMYAAVCWSRKMLLPNSGFVTILNEYDEVISNPGGTAPSYKNGELQPIRQAEKVFRHCHDVCVDEDENLYVCQWNAGGAYPMKLTRI